MAGRFAEAERLITEAAVLAEAIGEPDAWNVHTRQMWQLRSAQTRRVESEARLLATTLPHLRFWYQALLGLVLLERGEHAEGLRAIGPAVLARPEQIPYVLMVQWAELGEAAAAAGLPAAVQRYHDAMRPFAGTAAITAAAVGFDGAVDHHLGVLAAASGRLDDAVRHLEAAAVMHERLAAWPWLARTRCELAAVLATRGRPADRDRASALLDDVRQAAADFGMPGLLRRVDGIRLAPPNVFRRDGDGWHIAYAGKEIRLRDVKGLADLATLLFAPGQEVPAATLAAGGHAPADFDADPVLDRPAQRQYRARLAELDAAIADAHDTAHDTPTATLAGEHAFLSRELSAAVGLGHRDRRLGDDRERARKAVAGRIRDAIRRISAVHPALGDHLDGAISTGNQCAYRPAQPIRWQSSPAAARSDLASDP
jgi:tetratricopeptide (TPR) repeat protein